MPSRCFGRDLCWVPDSDDLLDPAGHICCVLFNSLQPRVSHEGSQVWSLGRVFPQTNVNKVPHLIAEDTTRQSRWWLIHNVLQELKDGHGLVHPLRRVRRPRRSRRRHQVLGIFQKCRPKGVGQMGWVWWWNGVASKCHF